MSELSLGFDSASDSHVEPIEYSGFGPENLEHPGEAAQPFENTLIVYSKPLTFEESQTTRFFNTICFHAHEDRRSACDSKSAFIGAV